MSSIQMTQCLHLFVQMILFRLNTCLPFWECGISLSQRVLMGHFPAEARYQVSPEPPWQPPLLPLQEWSTGFGRPPGGHWEACTWLSLDCPTGLSPSLVLLCSFS